MNILRWIKVRRRSLIGKLTRLRLKLFTQCRKARQTYSRSLNFFNCSVVNFSFSCSTVRGLNITRCPGPYNDSYTCPGLSDPPNRRHCCLWENQPACCLPGGSSCSDSHAVKRNYCLGPSDGRELTQCCVWNSQPTCCFPGGSSCSDSVDIRSYCPSPDHGSERTHCCVWDKQPTCCLPEGSACQVTHFRDYCPGPNDKKNDVRCCGNNDNKCCG